MMPRTDFYQRREIKRRNLSCWWSRSEARTRRTTTLIPIDGERLRGMLRDTGLERMRAGIQADISMAHAHDRLNEIGEEAARAEVDAAVAAVVKAEGPDLSRFPTFAEEAK
jgi:hypothetical protein